MLETSVRTHQPYRKCQVLVSVDSEGVFGEREFRSGTVLNCVDSEPCASPGTTRRICSILFSRLSELWAFLVRKAVTSLCCLRDSTKPFEGWSRLS